MPKIKQNTPYGLRAHSHLIGGAETNKNFAQYTISSTSLHLNQGDPVVFDVLNPPEGVLIPRPQDTIKLYQPEVHFTDNNNRNVVGESGPIVNQYSRNQIVGVFQFCEYIDADGKEQRKTHWEEGTVTRGNAIAHINIDPFVIWSIQLSSWMGGITADDATTFVTLPTLQPQDAGWPRTGGVDVADNAKQLANSGVIGSGVALLSGKKRGGAGSVSFANIVLPDYAEAYARYPELRYRDNPSIVDQGTAEGNSWGVSTFYACPSIACTAEGVRNGAKEYNRRTSPLKVIGYVTSNKNIPNVHGVTAESQGNYYNTPFLDVLVVIQQHAFNVTSSRIVVNNQNA